MTFTEFKKMDDLSKELLCWSNGIFVAARKDEVFKYKLYQVFAFYIEVQYKSPFQTLCRFSAFENTDKLEPYLLQVNIDNLY